MWAQIRLYLKQLYVTIQKFAIWNQYSEIIHPSLGRVTVSSVDVIKCL